MTVGPGTTLVVVERTVTVVGGAVIVDSTKDGVTTVAVERAVARSVLELLQRLDRKCLHSTVVGTVTVVVKSCSTSVSSEEGDSEIYTLVEAPGHDVAVGGQLIMVETSVVKMVLVTIGIAVVVVLITTVMVSGMTEVMVVGIRLVTVALQAISFQIDLDGRWGNIQGCGRHRRARYRRRKDDGDWWLVSMSLGLAERSSSITGTKLCHG